jgi:chromatin segregation and condensation protein Rec8/ScpA/Scc1 (kleisin family)
LAGLELTRRRMLVLRQAKPFAELWIYRRDDETGVPGDVSEEPTTDAETVAAEPTVTEGVEE